MKSLAIHRLKKAVEPYLFFWSEWTHNENCNLTPSEIALINHYILRNFQPDFFDMFQYTTQIKEIELLLGKLERGYPVFKEYVIVNFLYSIINYANEYGYDNFLRTPIHQLNIDADLKACLRRLNTYNLQIAFIIYKPEDFHRKWLYEIIVQFQTIKTKRHILNIGTSALVATRPHN